MTDLNLPITTDYVEEDFIDDEEEEESETGTEEETSTSTGTEEETGTSTGTEDDELTEDEEEDDELTEEYVSPAGNITGVSPPALTPLSPPPALSPLSPPPPALTPLSPPPAALSPTTLTPAAPTTLTPQESSLSPSIQSEDYTEEGLSSKTNSQLKEILKSKGLKVGGKKADLVRRILNPQPEDYPKKRGRPKQGIAPTTPQSPISPTTPQSPISPTTPQSPISPTTSQPAVVMEGTDVTATLQPPTLAPTTNQQGEVYAAQPQPQPADVEPATLESILVKTEAETNDMYVLRSTYSKLAIKMFNNQINVETADLIGRMAANKVLYSVNYPEASDRVIRYVDSILSSQIQQPN